MQDDNETAVLTEMTYLNLCEMLEELDLSFERDEEQYSIFCVGRGDDLPIPLAIQVDAHRMLVSLISGMPFDVPEERRTDMAVAVSYANYRLVDGSFDFSYKTGKLLFRLTASYRESLIGKDLLRYMLFCSVQTVDDYNDKFQTVAENSLTRAEIAALIK